MSSLRIIDTNYETLTEISDVPRISPLDEAVLKEIGDIILRYGQQQRFGVVLLHKHFDIAQGEKAVERVDLNSRTSVVDVESSTINAIPSVFRFRKST
ncbi:MAG: hypothetical protein KDK04_22530 [Candidatus Competibacteraceae bacterium]|nr:hypothetical protein [Candidatus Competibacteraceae bacterium]